MRILHVDVDDIDNPSGGGQGRRTAKINEILARDNDITVLSCGYPGARSTHKYGCRYTYSPSLRFPLATLVFASSVPMRIIGRRCDLVIEDFTSPISTLMTPLYSRAPVIGSAQFLFAKQMAEKYKLPFDAIERFGLKFYKYIIAMTDHDAQVLRSMAPNAEVVTIPEGIEADALQVLRAKQDYVAFMGRLDWHQKGLDVLSEIAAYISPIELRIAGDGPDRARVEKLATELPNVVYVGKVGGPARLDFLSQARMTVMPSRYETFGMVAIESLAVGTPVVCSNIANLSFAAGPLSIKHAPDDARGFAETIKNAFAVPLAESWVVAAKDYASQFTWDKLAARQASFYSHVVEQEKARRAGERSTAQ